MIDRRLFSLPGAPRIIAAVAVLSCARALCVMGQAWGLASAVVGLWNGESLHAQVYVIALFACCYVLRLALGYAQDALLDRFSERVAAKLRRELVQVVLDEGSPLVQRTGTGSITTLLVEGIEQVRSYVHLVLPKTIALGVVPLVLLVGLFALDWVSGLIALVSYPCIMLFMVLLGHTAKDEAAKQYRTFQRLSNSFIDSLHGLVTIKLFGRSREHGTRVYEASERHREATMRTLRVAMLSSAVLDLFATAALAAVAIMLGFRLVDGSMTLFPALMALMLVPEFFKPIRAFAADYHASLDGKNALEHISALIQGSTTNDAAASGSTCHDDAASGSATNDDAAPASSASVAVPSRPRLATVSVHNVSFSYPDQPAALHNVSFSFSSPACIGIVGASGAGKSTLASVLAGMSDPTAGSFEVDGFALQTLRDPSWLSRVAYIPQHPYVFHATLRENVAFYTPNASAEAIDAAVRAMGLEQLVADLPDGLDTVIGEGARTVSGGQAQRIALARVLLDPSRQVLVLDEPTAHLDIETEYELKQRMVPLMRGRLVFFATHRLHWMAQMNHVLVLDHGRIVEAGTPEQLAHQNGAFSRLAAGAGGAA